MNVASCMNLHSGIWCYTRIQAQNWLENIKRMRNMHVIYRLSNDMYRCPLS